MIKIITLILTSLLMTSNLLANSDFEYWLRQQSSKKEWQEQVIVLAIVVQALQKEQLKPYEAAAVRRLQDHYKNYFDDLDDRRPDQRLNLHDPTEPSLSPLHRFSHEHRDISLIELGAGAGIAGYRSYELRKESLAILKYGFRGFLEALSGMLIASSLDFPDLGAPTVDGLFHFNHYADRGEVDLDRVLKQSVVSNREDLGIQAMLQLISDRGDISPSLNPQNNKKPSSRNRTANDRSSRSSADSYHTPTFYRDHPKPPYSYRELKPKKPTPPTTKPKAETPKKDDPPPKQTPPKVKPSDKPCDPPSIACKGSDPLATTIDPNFAEERSKNSHMEFYHTLTIDILSTIYIDERFIAQRSKSFEFDQAIKIAIISVISPLFIDDEGSRGTSNLSPQMIIDGYENRWTTFLHDPMYN